MKKLVRSLSRLPSIGERTASRLAYFLITQDKEIAFSVSDSIKEAVNQVSMCERCFFLAESRLCSICTDDSRELTQICVVEKPVDLLAIERIGEYRGLYHVLHGLWAPLKGSNVNSIRIQELIERINIEPIREVIIATGSTVEGDATALYLAKMLQGKGVASSRIAQGMPKGGELEYADDVTLSRAMQGRSAI